MRLESELPRTTTTDSRDRDRASWLHRLRVFVPSIAAALMFMNLVDGGGAWWQWVSLALLIVLQVIALGIDRRSG